ncbi:MAG: hypothetical protein JXQ30_16655 [Spirochaetes bacterium]|nr:hypothetical protein [Spirochaetota bacterium]
MNLILSNSGGASVRVTEERWNELRKLGRSFGWKPLGTEPGDERFKHRYRDPDGGYDPAEVRREMESWNGSYRTGEGQRVSYADALNFAFALEEARKQGKGGLDEFIGFLKQGGFTITWY